MTIETTTNTEFKQKLTTVKQERFSGQLVAKSAKGKTWIFYLFLGRILYATGGEHPVRRWQRNLHTYYPKITLEQLKLLDNTSNASNTVFNISWEYQLLYSGVEQQLLSREQTAKIISAIVAEVLFDVTQAMALTIELKPENSSFPQLVLLDPGQAIAEVMQVWQSWQKASVSNYSPNHSPILKQPEQLQQQTSPAVYQTLTKLLDGQRSLRDVALIMKRDVLEVTCSLLPYVQAGLVELIDIPDLAAPYAPTGEGAASSPPQQGPLVACVDDSPLVCQTMEKILTNAGYQFLAVQDSLRAIATLLSRKPDLIFLDLVMPNTNGYEICTQLRKVSAFRETPIIILTGNDGIIDRVRAKVVGSTGFLSKPVNADTVLQVARSHLHHSSVDS